MVNHRTAVVSQIRGLLLDRGFAMAKSITRARRLIPEFLSDLKNDLTPMAREAIAELYDLMRDLDRRIGLFDQKIDRVFHSSEPCQRIAKIKVSVRRPPQPSLRRSVTAQSSRTVAISPPGLASCHDSSPAAIALR